MHKLDFDVENSADEEFFGNLRGRSNLGQLFGVERTDDNQTLKYQPNKRTEQTTSTKTANETANAWQTQMAKVASAYKAGQAVGKVGVALMYNSANAWRMILYKSKAQVLSTVSLLPQSTDAAPELYLQSRYLQYYDGDNICWSLHFDKPSDEGEFLEKLQEIGVKVKQEQNEPPLNTPNETSQLAQPAVKETASITASATDSSNVVHDSTDANHKHSKTSLISRMAKMGQQLPMYAAAATSSPAEYSDSSDTEVIATPGSLQPQHKPIVVPRSQRTMQHSHATQIVPLATAAGVANSEMGVFNGPAMETQFMQMLLTENRTQNTELRMNMNKLEGKLEKVLDKIDCLHDGNGTKSSKEDEILELEEKLLALKKENRKLRQNLENRPRTVDDDDELYARILRVHRKDLDAIGLTTATNNPSAVIAELIERIHKLQSTAQEGEVKIATTEQRLQQTEERLQEESVRHNKVAQDKDELQMQLDKLQEMLQTQIQRTTQLEQVQSEELKRMSEQLTAARSQTANTIKAIMNDLFVSVSTQLDELNVSQKEAILAILGRRIRELTLKAIQQTQPPPPLPPSATPPTMANQ